MPRSPFPHLLPSEGLIWARFLREHPVEWDRFEYDVHVGLGHPTEATQPDYIKVMIRKLSPKRIDVVGWQGRLPTIFEVSPRLGRATIGALFLYRYLFHQQFPDFPMAELVAVGPRVDPDIARFLASERVRVELTESIIHVLP